MIIKQAIVKSFLIFLLVILIFCFFFFKENNEVNIAQYNISNIRLDIPKPYHYGEYEKRGRWPKINSGIHETSYISIDVILPNLDAMNEINRHLFKELGWGSKIGIRLNSNPMHSFERIINNYKKREILIISNYSVKGLESYQLKRVKNGKPISDFLIKIKNEEVDLLVKCDLINEGISPSCKIDRLLKNGLHLQYIYSRDYIEQWQEIDSTVLNLLNSFCSEETNCLTPKKKGIKDAKST